ncbi:PepSY domain-containing protein [Brevundimonas sp. S30B]|uniref:PepSY-associated TM helix domain-containing protein n=1 Tax=unclassified Brevundimonas TaxID=2622653 RepID=UPI001071A404|nr:MULTISPECIES: PepSY domain-containing protein [unclassified Brevundimonas]QBX38732.1 PepSY domain-containing protein [Brevundimonas sp. MF30-B]TFW01324.1 PepSY domain-containing protein [Brevundimonas sp. S30B]
MSQTPSKPARNGLSDAYRAVWRWHFYAGLFVMPVLMLMALTGAMYLFKPEIEDAVYRDMAVVQPAARTVSPDRWVASAERNGGTASSVLVSDRPDRAVRVTVRQDGESRIAFVDPYTAALNGTVQGEGVMGVVQGLHSLTLLGKPFNILVEIVAGWAVILVATGIFLWWPRRRDAAVAVPRAGDPARRPFWRDLHAVTGLYAGGVIVFLALTGMPWSAVWGDKFLNVVRESGLGRPAAPPAASPWAHGEGHDAPAGVGWTMENAVMHANGDHSGHVMPSLSRVIRTARAEDVPLPYTVSIPSDPTLAYTVAHAAVRAEDARSLYVDGVTGEVKADIRWSQFGVGAKAFEWGIAVHQGTQYGWANRIVMLSGCIAVWLLGISGLIMWWKRRPARSGLGAPTAPPGPRARAAVLGIVLPLAVLFPLTGLSLVAALALDWTIRRVRR